MMGSGNLVRTCLHRTARGTLIELPLAWDAEKGGSWALNPGLDVSDPPIGRKIGYDCMFCHNSYPSIPSGHEDAGSEPVFTGQLPQGIDCQRCHGPGGNHVQALRQRGAKLSDVRSAIVNSSRLGKERAIEICVQCHLETTSAPLPERNPPLRSRAVFFPSRRAFERVSTLLRSRARVGQGGKVRDREFGVPATPVEVFPRKQGGTWRHHMSRSPRDQARSGGRRQV